MTSSDKRAPRQVPPPEGVPPRPAGGYSRFIPREELAAFASWTPDPFVALDEAGASGFGAGLAGGLRRAPATPVPPPPAPEPEQPPEVVAPTEAEWLADIQEARQAGYHDGYRDGLEALEAAKRQHLQQVTAQYAALAASLDAQMQALEAQMADAVTRTALVLARQVVRSELTQRPALVRQVAQESLGAVMLSARHLRLRLHPEDAALVAADDGEALRSRDVQLLPDASLTRGGCVLESDLGRVDARVEHRWAQAAAVFGAELPLAGEEGDA